jgi:hypothetical protein
MREIRGDAGLFASCGLLTNLENRLAAARYMDNWSSVKGVNV